MTDKLYQVTSPHFCAGVVERGGFIVEAAPILAYMVAWSYGRVQSYCQKKRWRLQEV